MHACSDVHICTWWHHKHNPPPFKLLYFLTFLHSELQAFVYSALTQHPYSVTLTYSHTYTWKHTYFDTHSNIHIHSPSHWDIVALFTKLTGIHNRIIKYTHFHKCINFHCHMSPSSQTHTQSHTGTVTLTRTDTSICSLTFNTQIYINTVTLTAHRGLHTYILTFSYILTSTTTQSKS